LTDAFFKERSAAVSGDGEQPGSQRPLGIPPLQTSEGPQKGVLGNILRVLELAEHPIAQPEDRSLVPFDERAHARFIAGQTTPDQDGIVVVHETPCVPKNHTRRTAPRFQESAEPRSFRAGRQYTVSIQP
jgi:hypothetical protein